MRWAYKTVLYPLQKDGLLGGSFIDETEMECSLNEYGRAGWELVTLLEGVDGFRAVFKQPFGGEEDEEFIPAAMDIPIAGVAAPTDAEGVLREPAMEPVVTAETGDDEKSPAVEIEEDTGNTDSEPKTEPSLFGSEEQGDMLDEDVGSIRIE